MADLAQLQRKLHSYQVILWLKQTFEEVADEDGHCEGDDKPARDVREDCGSRGAPGHVTCVSKSSVYEAYVMMCNKEGRPSMFTRAVVGKMVKRAFPLVRTKRRGPRGRVTQHYIGLCPIRSARPVRQDDDLTPTEDLLHYQEASADTAAGSCASPITTSCQTAGFLQCVDATSNQSEVSHLSANNGEEVDVDQEPGLCGSGEWHTEGDFTPRSFHTIRTRLSTWGALPRPHSSCSHGSSTSPSWPGASLPSLPERFSGSVIRAPYLPSTLAAMGQQPLVPVALQTPLALEALESAWDWPQGPPATSDGWLPQVVDIAASDNTQVGDIAASDKAEASSQAPVEVPVAPVGCAWSTNKDLTGDRTDSCQDDIEALLAWADALQ